MVCEVCPFSSECSLKGKVPENKFTSSKDILLLMYFMVKNAQLKEYAANGRDSPVNSQPAAASEKAESTGNWKSLLEEEADRQMKGFEEQAEGVQVEEKADKEKDFVLYLSGLRILDNLKMVAPKNDVERAQTLDLLEQNVSEFTIKKKTDIILETRGQIRRSISKKKNKRDDKRGIHDLVLESNHKMKQFAVEANAGQQSASQHAADGKVGS